MHTFMTLTVSDLQNFKREEQNFVVMNEINNMSFLTADSKSKMSKVSLLGDVIDLLTKNSLSPVLKGWS